MKPFKHLFWLVPIIIVLLTSGCQTKVDVYTTPSAEPPLESSGETTSEPAPEAAPAAEEAPPAVYRFNLNITGNGKVTTDSTLMPAEYRASASFEVPSGTVVNLSATPDAGWRFDHWEGACTGTVCGITIDGDKTVTAVYLGETVALTVNLRNVLCGNRVSVTLDPPGTDCVAEASTRNSCVYSFATGTTVRISVNPGPGCEVYLGDVFPYPLSGPILPTSPASLVVNSEGWVTIGFTPTP